MTILIPLLFALAGALIYGLSSNPKVVELGRIMFWCGLLVTLFRVDSASISLLGK